MSEQDMYRVCVITMRGWKLEYDGWKKDGVVRELAYHEKESNDYYTRNNLSLKFDGADHTLEEAHRYEEGR